MIRDPSSGKEDSRIRSDGSWRRVWRVLKTARAMAVVLLLVVSLAANAALFVGGVLYNVVDEALARVTGLETATSKQRKVSDDLRRENRQLVDRNRKLQTRMAKVQQANGRLKGPAARLRKVTRDAVKRTVARSAVAATRAVATAPAKAFPYLGTAVVVGVTALEIRSYCKTIRDMNLIQKEIAPTEAYSEDERTVCGMEAPTRDDIWNHIKKEPLHMWNRSRDFLPDLDPILPHIEDQLDAWLQNSENLLSDGWESLLRMLKLPD